MVVVNLFGRERPSTEEEALKKHKRLNELFKTDRFAFKRECLRMTDELLRSRTPERREKIKKIQKEIDAMMKGAGTLENKLSLINALMISYVVNEFLPAIEAQIERLEEINFKYYRKRSSCKLIK